MCPLFSFLVTEYWVPDMEVSQCPEHRMFISAFLESSHQQQILSICRPADVNITAIESPVPACAGHGTPQSWRQSPRLLSPRSTCPRCWPTHRQSSRVPSAKLGRGRRCHLHTWHPPHSCVPGNVPCSLWRRTWSCPPAEWCSPAPSSARPRTAEWTGKETRGSGEWCTGKSSI